MLNREGKIRKFNSSFCAVLLCISALLMSGCIVTVPVSDEDAVSVTLDPSSNDPIIFEAIETGSDEGESNGDILSEDQVETEVKISEEELVPFNVDEAFSYCEQPVCYYDKETGLINYSIQFNSIPKSDDLYIYLFEMAGYEGDEEFDGKPYIASTFKDYEVTLTFPYNTKHLFSKFVPVIAYDKKFYPISLGQYITNPEDIADNDTPYPEIASKKGILLDPMTIDKEELNSLNVKRVVYNIPLSFIMGETDNDACPTVDYEYLGQVYHFNGFMLAGFDDLFRYLTDNDFLITAIVLNDLNSAYPEIIHPLSRNRKSKTLYYAFNTEEKEGVRAMEAAALFLADRYSGGDYGLIHDWVIANEINQHKRWNYMATDDLDLYVESFEKSFRTFYNAIKSRYKNADVSFSIDHDWNDNGGLNYIFFNGKDVLNSFNEKAKSRGNYDWGLSIHPYPSPLTNTKFWYGYRDKSEKASIVTPMNISVITDYMSQDDFLDTKGNVRQIGVTELGFSSNVGEKIQAAAFAYCYYIINDNEYIKSFLMNRQTDSYLSLRSGLALGIYNPDYSSKYIKDVFANIDNDMGEEYIDEMLKIIGAKDLDEALSWAR